MEYSNNDVINNSGKETKSDVMEKNDSKPQLHQLTTESEVPMVTENPTPTRTLQTKFVFILHLICSKTFIFNRITNC